MLLMLIFVVGPLVGFALVIVLIYRRVTHNRSTYRGSTDIMTAAQLYTV